MSLENAQSQAPAAASCYPPVDARLDDIFDVIDDLLLAGEFRKVDTLLWALQEREDFSLQLGVLTITAAAASKLPSRQAIFTRVSRWCAANGLDSSILAGLG